MLPSIALSARWIPKPPVFVHCSCPSCFLSHQVVPKATEVSAPGASTHWDLRMREELSALGHRPKIRSSDYDCPQTVSRFYMLDLWLEASQDAGDVGLPSRTLTTRFHSIWGRGQGLLGCSSWLQKEGTPKGRGMTSMWGERRQMGAGSWGLIALIIGPLIL